MINVRNRTTTFYNDVILKRTFEIETECNQKFDYLKTESLSCVETWLSWRRKAQIYVFFVLRLFGARRSDRLPSFVSHQQSVHLAQKRQAIPAQLHLAAQLIKMYFIIWTINGYTMNSKCIDMYCKVETELFFCLIL